MGFFTARGVRHLKSTHSTPRSEARGMLRVDTERRFLPRFENRGLAPSNVSIQLAFSDFYKLSISFYLFPDQQKDNYFRFPFHPPTQETTPTGLRAEALRRASTASTVLEYISPVGTLPVTDLLCFGGFRRASSFPKEYQVKK